LCASAVEEFVQYARDAFEAQRAEGMSAADAEAAVLGSRVDFTREHEISCRAPT
jgi:hypothetical protein